MKKIFTYLFLSVFSTAALAQTQYSGNGASGFGGPIGNGTLTITADASNIYFNLVTGVSFSGNALVLYFDSKSGGVNDNSTFTDQGGPGAGDAGRRTVSGLSSNGKTPVVFPSGFLADFAISVQPGEFAGLYDLSDPANFGFVGSANLSGSGSNFNFSIPKSGLQLSSTTFSFVGTLISTTAYRSNESFGNSVTAPGSPGDAPNAGFTGSTTFSSFFSYTNSILSLPNNGNVPVRPRAEKIRGNEVMLIENPVRDVVSIRINNPRAMQYTIILHDMNGRVTDRVRYNHGGGMTIARVPIKSPVTGMFPVHVLDADGRSSSLKVLRQ